MSQRKAIIQLFCAGKTNPEIFKILKALKSTVQDVVNQYKKLGTSDDRPKSGQPQTARTSTKIKAIRERIRRSPKWIRSNLKKMARDLKIDKKTVRTIVKDDLKLSPLKMTNRHQLTALQKQKRMERTKIFLNRLKDGTDAGEIIFSDEKILSVEAQFNSQNDRILAKSADNIYRRQKPASAMVWAAISENWKSTLIFVKEGTKLNANSYIEDILTPAHVEMKKHYKDDPFTFQQDGAPSHTINKTQDWCESHFPAFCRKELWLPSLPDLNHLDFCV